MQDKLDADTKILLESAFSYVTDEKLLSKFLKLDPTEQKIYIATLEKEIKKIVLNPSSFSEKINNTDLLQLLDTHQILSSSLEKKTVRNRMSALAKPVMELPKKAAKGLSEHLKQYDAKAAITAGLAATALALVLTLW